MGKKLPPVGTLVVATVRGFHSGQECVEFLVRVKESDVTWRTADDGSELDERNFSVVKWRLPWKPEIR